MYVRDLKIDPAKLEKARGRRTRAEVAKAVGVSRVQIWHLENGKSRPSSDLLVKLCTLYGVDLSDITSEGQNFLPAA